MQTSKCPPLRNKRAQSAQLFTCDPKTRRWKLVDPTQGLVCNPRSPHQIDPRYVCNPIVGQFRLKNEFKHKVLPGVPKRALGSYFLWMRDHRGEIVEETELKGNELAREMGRRWREEVSDEEKKRYKSLSEEGSIRYNKQIQEYKVKSGYQPVMGVVKKGERRPSYLRMAYLDWYKENYKELQEQGLLQGAIMKKLKKNWQLIKNDIIQQINAQVILGNELQIDYPQLQ